MIKKIVFLSFLLMVLFSFAITPVLAAADADLVNAIASSTALATDNKVVIIGFILAVLTVVFVIVLSKKGFMWAVAKIISVFSRRRRK